VEERASGAAARLFRGAKWRQACCETRLRLQLFPVRCARTDEVIQQTKDTTSAAAGPICTARSAESPAVSFVGLSDVAYLAAMASHEVGSSPAWFGITRSKTPTQCAS
jgi:hypothetical protein